MKNTLLFLLLFSWSTISLAQVVKSKPIWISEIKGGAGNPIFFTISDDEQSIYLVLSGSDFLQYENQLIEHEGTFFVIAKYAVDGQLQWSKPILPVEPISGNIGIYPIGFRNGELYFFGDYRENINIADTTLQEGLSIFKFSKDGTFK